MMRPQENAANSGTTEGWSSISQTHVAHVIAIAIVLTRVTQRQSRSGPFTCQYAERGMRGNAGVEQAVPLHGVTLQTPLTV